MAVFLSKCEELLRLIPDLQCHKCKNVPGPNGTQKNRYSCTNSAHTLCEEHKTICLCGSKVGKSPSPVIANLLQNLPWMCQNYNNGCREIKMNVEDLDHHQGKCIYRNILCPHVACKPDQKVLFKDFIDHLETCHKRMAVYDLTGEDSNNFIARKTTKPHGMQNRLGWMSKVVTSCGAVFFSVGKIANDTVYQWLVFMGSSDEARNYSYNCSVTNITGQEFIYKGSVPTLDDKSDDIITSGSLLGIGINAAKRSLNEEKELEVEFTIRNLKEEAKDDDMESGVSNDDMESSGVSDGE